MNKKTCAILSLVLAILPVIVLFLNVSLSTLKTITLIAIVVEIAAIVLGFVSKKEAKGMAIAGIIIGFLVIVLFAFELIGIKGMTEAKNCVDQGNGTAICEFMGKELEVPMQYLTEDQMKKEEE